MVFGVPTMRGNSACVTVRSALSQASESKRRNRRSFPQLPESLAEMPQDREGRMKPFITPLIERYCKGGQLVLDPFADEAVSVSIPSLNRPYILVEDEQALHQSHETLDSQQ
jgi:hypothetical protein